MTVLPDDPPRAGVDQDHPVAVVVVRGDQPVREPHRQRRLVEQVRPGRVAERPRHRPRGGHLDDLARVGERRRRGCGRSGGVGRRRGRRPASAPTRRGGRARRAGRSSRRSRSRAGPPSGSGRVAVRAREPARRVVGAAAAEDAHDRPARRELDDAAVPDVRDGECRRSAGGRRRRACSGSRARSPGRPRARIARRHRSSRAPPASSVSLNSSFVMIACQPGVKKASSGPRSAES